MNALLAEVVATAIEKMSDRDDRLVLLTVTGVSTEEDLRHATVLFASLSDRALEALEEHRVALQSAIGSGGRMKRTPTLSFLADPAVAAGEAVEDAIRRLHDDA
ncbi:MAG: ribosome-binding factor A [Acidimicrobiales bacterium]